MTFLRIVLCCQAAIFNFQVPVPLGLISCSSRCSRCVEPCQSPQLWSQMKVKSRLSLSLNLHPSTKMIISVIKNVYICLFFTAGDVFFCEKTEGEVSVVHIVMKKWMRDTSYAFVSRSTSASGCL